MGLGIARNEPTCTLVCANNFVEDLIRKSNRRAKIIKPQEKSEKRKIFVSQFPKTLSDNTKKDCSDQGQTGGWIGRKSSLINVGNIFKVSSVHENYPAHSLWGRAIVIGMFLHKRDAE